LIEAKTYRFRGHYEGDPQTYRTGAEVEEWKKRDPIVLHERRLLEAGVADSQLDAIRADVADQVQAAAERALASPKPRPERAFEGVLA
jgi:TPP-dependent pyruvate/acetoin dehydrogenase alpha subunit